MDVGGGTFEFAVGNNNTSVDNLKVGNNAAINVAGTEVAVKTDVSVTDATVQSTINGYGNITTMTDRARADLSAWMSGGALPIAAE